MKLCRSWYKNGSLNHFTATHSKIVDAFPEIKLAYLTNVTMDTVYVHAARRFMVELGGILVAAKDLLAFTSKSP